MCIIHQSKSGSYALSLVTEKASVGAKQFNTLKIAQ